MIRPGQTIGPLTIERLLGRGGMGEVWLGQQTALGRPVAIKLIAGHLTERPGTIERFAREAACLARLNHPQIVTIHEYGEHTDGDGDRHHVLVMEYVPGSTSARNLLRGPVPWRIATGICAQVAQALAVAHAAGIVHRDIKPDNILLAPDGQANLADFGLARGASDTPLTQPGTTQGSPPYLPPEGWRGERCAEPADLYSLGVTLYHLLAGQAPYRADSQWALMEAHCTAPIPRLVIPGLPEPVALLVAAAMAKQPAERPASAATFATVLHQALDGGFHPEELTAWLRATGDTFVKTREQECSMAPRDDGLPPPTTIVPSAREIPPSASADSPPVARTLIVPAHKRDVKKRWIAIGGLTAVIVCVSVWLAVRSPPTASHEAEGRVMSATDLAAKKRLDVGLAAAIAAVQEQRFSEARTLLSGLASDAQVCGRQAEVEAALARIPKD